MELTPKQQTSEAVRQAETILITTGQRPNVDQVASVLALAAILRKFGKQVSAIISDPVPGPAQFMDASGLDKELGGLRDFILKVDVSKTEVDKLRYEVEDNKLNVYITPFKGKFAPSDVTFGYGGFHYDLAIVLGVPKRDRIDRVYADNKAVFDSIPVVNIDFHRINENYGAVNLVEPTASSLSEMLVALSESLQSGLIDADIATVMLAGLMASTDRFTAAHTTSKSLTVAAQMMAAGARQQQVAKGLFGREERPARGNDRPGERPADRPANQPRPQARPEPRVDTRPDHRLEPQQRSETDSKAEPVGPVPMESVEEPLIMPDHIELMPQEEGSAVPEQAEDQFVRVQNDFEAVEVVEEAPEEVPAPTVPMADFAAAAEILRQRRDELAQEESTDQRA